MTHGEVFWLFVGFVLGATALSLGYRILGLIPQRDVEPKSPVDAVRILAGKPIRQPVIYNLDPSDHPDFPGRN